MTNLYSIVPEYLSYCIHQKRLDPKTIKAYRIDLRQFCEYCNDEFSSFNDIATLEIFITTMHEKYKPKTVRRKLATVKAFYRYLEYKEYIRFNPFNKLQVKFRDPIVLPKTIPMHIIERLITFLYQQQSITSDKPSHRTLIRDIAVIELLFSTGIRISELCSLKTVDVDTIENSILIYGKGSKERRLQIGNTEVLNALANYHSAYSEELSQSEYFFVNRLNNRLSEQSIRNMIVKYSKLASISLHITPHMFRHSFATYLLEEDVDIRYIQEMLGHSSIHITEIYTHVTIAKQKDILTTKHPRNHISTQ